MVLLSSWSLLTAKLAKLNYSMRVTPRNYHSTQYPMGGLKIGGVNYAKTGINDLSSAGAMDVRFLTSTRTQTMCWWYEWSMTRLSEPTRV